MEEDVVVTDGLLIAAKPSVASLDDCYALCEAEFLCYAAQYSRGDQTCKLVGRSSAKPFADFGNLIVKYKDCRETKR